MWKYDLGPMYMLEPVTRKPDLAGNILVHFNPGRLNGVIVLRPTGRGFRTFGSLPNETEYDEGDFYSAVARDVDGDRVYEIIQGTNNCDPSCGNGTSSQRVYEWDGRRYAPGP